MALRYLGPTFYWVRIRRWWLWPLKLVLVLLPYIGLVTKGWHCLICVKHSSITRLQEKAALTTWASIFVQAVFLQKSWLTKNTKELRRKCTLCSLSNFLCWAFDKRWFYWVASYTNLCIHFFFLILIQFLWLIISTFRPCLFSHLNNIILILWSNFSYFSFHTLVHFWLGLFIMLKSWAA